MCTNACLKCCHECNRSKAHDDAHVACIVRPLLQVIYTRKAIEMCQRADRLRDEGNTLYRGGNTRGARMNYCSAILKYRQVQKRSPHQFDDAARLSYAKCLANRAQMSVSLAEQLALTGGPRDKRTARLYLADAVKDLDEHDGRALSDVVTSALRNKSRRRRARLQELQHSLQDV